MKSSLKFLVLALSLCFLAKPALAYDYGDFRSVTLVGKAWGALGENDIEAVLAYTNKVIELYAGEAKKMQANLTDYPQGKEAEVHAYWALNDVATAYFIQGEAYRKADMKEEAKGAFQTIVDDYLYGQCWDPKGWFWKPADAAKEKMAIMESGVAVDFSDNSSSALTSQAWNALNNKDVDAVLLYTNKVLELYEAQAKEMQGSLTAFAWESKDKVFSYWALNDVGTALFIQGKAFADAGRNDEAKKAYQRVIDEFGFAQCWDPGGWFWKPAEAASGEIQKLESGSAS